MSARRSHLPCIAQNKSPISIIWASRSLHCSRCFNSKSCLQCALSWCRSLVNRNHFSNPRFLPSNFTVVTFPFFSTFIIYHLPIGHCSAFSQVFALKKHPHLTQTPSRWNLHLLHIRLRCAASVDSPGVLPFSTCQKFLRNDSEAKNILEIRPGGISTGQTGLRVELTVKSGSSFFAGSVRMNHLSLCCLRLQSIRNLLLTVMPCNSLSLFYIGDARCQCCQRLHEQVQYKQR